MAWLQDPDSSSLAHCGKEAIKSFTIRFIISVFTIKRAVIVLGLFYLCLFILFHCLYKSHSHFVLLGFCPFQLLTDEWGKKSRLANNIGQGESVNTELPCWLLSSPRRSENTTIFFFSFSIFMVPLRLTGTLDCCCLCVQAVQQYPSLTVCIYFNGLWNPGKGTVNALRYRWGKQKWSSFSLAFGGK